MNLICVGESRSKAALAAAFAARRCGVCGAPASCVRPGAEAQYQLQVRRSAAGTRRTLMLLHPAVADADFCLAHAWEGSRGAGNAVPG